VLTYVPNGPGGAPVTVEERIVPTDSGWVRSVRVSNVPEGVRPVLAECPPAGARDLAGGYGLRWDVGTDRVTLAAHEGPMTASESSTGERSVRPARRVAMKAEVRGVYEGLLHLSVGPAP
jgi:hypothetical protein